MDASLPTRCTFCGSTFGKSQGLTRHQGTCKARKQKIAAVQISAKTQQLEKRALIRKDAEERASKRQCLDRTVDGCVEPSGSSATDAQIDDVPVLHEEGSVIEKEPDLPKRRKISRPKRYKDFVAAPFSGLPPETDDPLSPAPFPGPPPKTDTPLSSAPNQTSTTEEELVTDPEYRGSNPLESTSRRLPTRRRLVSDRNEYGLYRVFWAPFFPSHDPDSCIFPTNESDFNAAYESDEDGPDSSAHPIGAADSQQDPMTPLSYYPYSNESSFRLGSWYWSGTGQKTQSNFQDLVDIISDDSFIAQDLSNSNWGRINDALATGNHGQIRESHDNAKPDYCSTSYISPHSESLPGETNLRNDNLWQDEIGDGWRCAPVTINVPFHSRTANPGVHTFTSSPGFYHRSIIDIMREKVTDIDNFRHFHLEPYELYWQPDRAQQPQRVQGELYTSPAFVEAHRDLHNTPGEPGCDLERVVFGLIFGSDESRLASFGNAKLWPGYVWAANDSKYIRSCPTAYMAHHFAYFEKLPDTFTDFFVSKSGGKRPSNALLTHCHREFFHAQWREVLDDDFVEAYLHGVTISCADGIMRRFYIRIFVYSADYPEKILIAGIRNLGTHLCPRCLVKKTAVRLLGSAADREVRSNDVRSVDDAYSRLITEARKLIYESNYAVDSEHVEALLKPESLVPTLNAFYSRLYTAKFDVFKVLTVDFLHEFEIGSWKSVFIHLLRILQSIDPLKLLELNKRFRMVPTFGRETIRKFSSDISSMKQLAARDFEDILQCSLPVFRGMIPGEEGKAIERLLFLLAHWHSFAKLRLHHDRMLQVLDELTTKLGAMLRIFESEISPRFKTKELPREAAARSRREAKNSQKRENSTSVDQIASHDLNAQPGFGLNTGKGAKKERLFSLEAYKPHALGDYVSTIRFIGTTDSISTQNGEQAHRTPKANFRRTSKKAFTKQLSRIERIQATLRRMDRTYRRRKPIQRNNRKQRRLESRNLDLHHHIASSQKKGIQIGCFLQSFKGDPAVMDFYQELRLHLLPRLKNQLIEEEKERSLRGQVRKAFLNGATNDRKDDEGLDRLFIKDNMMYAHQLFRVNYTSYDVRRLQDIVHPGTSHSDIMMLSSEIDSFSDSFSDSAKAWFVFARVLGVYHVNVVYSGPGSVDYNPRRFEFLHVRWFQHLEEESGWDTCSLDRLSFPPIENAGSFGFVDPADVVRAGHIIPDFNAGRPPRMCGWEQTAAAANPLSGLLPSDNSFTRSKLAQDKNDWVAYYHNRFVDRDMVMRHYPGLAIGHKYAFDVTSSSHQESPINDIPDIEVIHSQRGEETLSDGPDNADQMEWELGDQDDDKWVEEIFDGDSQCWDSEGSYESGDEDD